MIQVTTTVLSSSFELLQFCLSGLVPVTALDVRDAGHGDAGRDVAPVDGVQVQQHESLRHQNFKGRDKRLNKSRANSSSEVSL